GLQLGEDRRRHAVAAHPRDHGARHAGCRPRRQLRAHAVQAGDMRRSRITGRQAGFTLIELLVAVAIVGVTAAAIAAPFARTTASRDATERAMERTAAARVTLS